MSASDPFTGRIRVRLEHDGRECGKVAETLATMKARNLLKTETSSEARSAAPRTYVSSFPSKLTPFFQTQHGTGSEKLTDKQVREVVAAAEFALVELPLNRFLTINWERAGAQDPAASTRKFLKLAGDFCRSQQRAFAYVWIMEPSAKIGLHAHILMRLDHDIARRFGQLQRGWVKRAGGRSAKGTLKTKHVGGASAAYLRRVWDEGAFAGHHRSVVNYMLKHCSFEIARELGLPSPTRSGLVAGQRVGCSYNLGPKARREAALAAGAGCAHRQIQDG